MTNAALAGVDGNWTGLAIRSSPEGERRMVDQNSASWNRVAEWLTRIGTLRSLCTAE